MASAKNHNVTMNDIAARAGVSQSTVSRVINNHPRINAATRDAVQKAMHELGYRAHTSRASSGGGNDPSRRSLIGLVMCPLPEQKNAFSLDYFSELLQGVHEGLAGSNTDVVLFTMSPGAQQLEIPEKRLREISGLILLSFPSDGLLEDLRRHGINYVISTGEAPVSHLVSDTVEADHMAANMELCRHMLNLGYDRFGLFMSRLFPSRVAAFRIAMRNQGKDIADEDLYLLDSTDNSAFIAATHDYIARGHLPRAIVVCFYSAALVMRSVLECNNIRVPEDIQIFTFGHRPEHNQFPLVMGYPRQHGLKAARRLLEKIANPNDPPHRTVIPMHLVPDPAPRNDRYDFMADRPKRKKS